jgi:hypothetical protein
MTMPYTTNNELDRPLTLAEPLELPEAAKQELEALNVYISVPVSADVKVRVKPQIEWRMSTMRLLNAGDLDGWAESVIHPDDLDTFIECDLTMGEFGKFSEDAARLAGDGLGKSSERSRSSKSTRAR